MASTSIPFSSLHTDNPIELFWVIFNSIIPIFNAYAQYVAGLVVLLVLLINWNNGRRTAALEKTVRKEIKRAKSPHR